MRFRIYFVLVFAMFTSWLLVQNALYLGHKAELEYLKSEWGSCPILRDNWVIECDGKVHREEYRYREYECQNTYFWGEKQKGKVECFFKLLPDLLK